MGALGRNGVPGLDRDQLRDLIVSITDVIIALDDNYVIVGVTGPASIDNLTMLKWTGRKVQDVVSPESAPKLLRILRAETPGAEPSQRWSHINFLDAASGSLPLLVKYFWLPGGATTTRLIAGRDLRPMEEAQKGFRNALAEHGPSPPSPQAEPYDPSADFDALFSSKPFDAIVAEARDLLQRTFFAEALRRANGDNAEAAKLLGLDKADFLRRLRREGAR